MYTGIFRPESQLNMAISDNQIVPWEIKNFDQTNPTMVTTIKKSVQSDLSGLEKVISCYWIFNFFLTIATTSSESFT